MAKLVAAIEEKKIARHYTAGELPQQAIAGCLQIARLTPEQVDCRRCRAAVRAADTSATSAVARAVPECAACPGGASHGACRFGMVSRRPSTDATVLTLDRAGDLRCGARWHGDGAGLADSTRRCSTRIRSRDLYGRVTELLGFQSNADEHKVQWLSTAGDDRFVALFEAMIVWDGDNWPRIDRTWF